MQQSFRNKYREINHWKNFPEPDIIPLNAPNFPPPVGFPVYDDK